MKMDDRPITTADLWRIAVATACDKCGGVVPRTNDMVWLMAFTGLPGTALWPLAVYSRHVLPVLTEDGTVRCEGSPSRAQYLPGQPRDTRGYGYHRDLEGILRAAWDRLQSYAGSQI